MSVLLAHSGLILHEIAFDHVTQRQHHVHSLTANCEMFSMSPIKVLISNYLEHISSVSSSPSVGCMSRNTHVKRLVCIGFKTEVISSVAIWLRKAQIGAYDNEGLELRPWLTEEWGGRLCLVVTLCHHSILCKHSHEAPAANQRNYRDATLNPFYLI